MSTKTKLKKKSIPFLALAVFVPIHVTLLLTMVTAKIPLRQHTTSSPGHAKVLPEVVVQSADSGMRIGG